MSIALALLEAPSSPQSGLNALNFLYLRFCFMKSRTFDLRENLLERPGISH
ncbi:hypothetical protein MARPO_0003s0052 [Marchantia polymorpha]|uniref:Uncharacterized protein n=1 Tax=Marchantia polymorpha TaxID=3197 RepID=A0A2R6XSS3_MARPO|nr:hypothetical protein MARPO_0003s0052 [Marchantia polymorpha]|eukprot:PTQ49149.1 hypothetical protein MARPO_0003s0052 [Marchantia polymorpha]